MSALRFSYFASLPLPISIIALCISCENYALSFLLLLFFLLIFFYLQLDPNTLQTRNRRAIPDASSNQTNATIPSMFWFFLVFLTLKFAVWILCTHRFQRRFLIAFYCQKRKQLHWTDPMVFTSGKENSCILVHYSANEMFWSFLIAFGAFNYFSKKKKKGACLVPSYA